MIFLGLGGNMPSERFGPPRATLEAALSALKRHGIQVCRRSRWYHSRPVPDDGQPWYVNGVSEIATTSPPGELLARLLEIEREFGRERRKRWAPRTIDLDLLAYHELSNWAADPGPAPVLPHPRLQARAFRCSAARSRRCWKRSPRGNMSHRWNPFLEAARRGRLQEQRPHANYRSGWK